MIKWYFFFFFLFFCCNFAKLSSKYLDRNSHSNGRGVWGRIGYWRWTNTCRWTCSTLKRDGRPPKAATDNLRQNKGKCERANQIIIYEYQESINCRGNCLNRCNTIRVLILYACGLCWAVRPVPVLHYYGLIFQHAKLLFLFILCVYFFSLLR